MGFKSIILVLFVLVSISGCKSEGEGNETSQPDHKLNLTSIPEQNKNQNGSPNQESLPPKKLDADRIRANHQKFFEPSKTSSELFQDRDQFLDQERIIANPDPKKRYKWTHKLNMGYFRKGPPPSRQRGVVFVGQYEDDSTPVLPRYFLRISSAFLPNIPGNIKAAISEYELDEVELYFVIQGAVGGMDFLDQSNNIMLVSHFWGYEGAFYKRTMEMGIFEADHDISKQIQIETLQPFTVELHSSATFHAAISPNTAGLNIKQSMLDTSFYSVVIDQDKKRAAVTLHFMPSKEHFLLNDGSTLLFDPFDSRNSTVRKVLARLHQDADVKDYFVGSPILRKLDQLFQVSP